MRFATNFSVFLILFFCLFTIVNSAVHMEKKRSKPGHENQCYVEGENKFYEAGEEMKWGENGCGRKVCRGSLGNGMFSTEIQTCGTPRIPRHCRVSVNLQLPYPDCCPQVICLKGKHGH